MKPDWKDAPEWANYLAMDANGDWHWYELKPLDCSDGWFPSLNGEMFSRVSLCSVENDWEDSLEKRPE